jgi:hypothetical protein
MLPPISPNLHIHDNIECLERRVGGRFCNYRLILHDVSQMLGGGSGLLGGFVDGLDRLFAFTYAVQVLLAVQRRVLVLLLQECRAAAL